MLLKALCIGNTRSAACLLLAFHGPAPIGDVLTCKRCKRKNLVPRDSLFDPPDRVMLEILKPKPRNRGGAAVQHVTFVSESVSCYLDKVLGDLPGDTRL